MDAVKVGFLPISLYGASVWVCVCVLLVVTSYHITIIIALANSFQHSILQNKKTCCNTRVAHFIFVHWILFLCFCISIFHWNDFNVQGNCTTPKDVVDSDGDADADSPLFLWLFFFFCFYISIHCKLWTVDFRHRKIARVPPAWS